jgi:hypothetical protein
MGKATDKWGKESRVEWWFDYFFHFVFSYKFGAPVLHHFSKMF